MPEARKNDEVILNEIKHIRGDMSSMDRKIEGLDTNLTALALQTQQIAAITERVVKLENWNVDQANELKDLATFQGGCPRFSVDKVIDKQWTAITVLASSMIGGFAIMTTIMVVVL